MPGCTSLSALLVVVLAAIFLSARNAMFRLPTAAPETKEGLAKLKSG
jgi:hypothetical protein